MVSTRGQGKLTKRKEPPENELDDKPVKKSKQSTKINTAASKVTKNRITKPRSKQVIALKDSKDRVPAIGTASKPIDPMVPKDEVELKSLGSKAPQWGIALQENLSNTIRVVMNSLGVTLSANIDALGVKLDNTHEARTAVEPTYPPILIESVPSGHSLRTTDEHPGKQSDRESEEYSDSVLAKGGYAKETFENLYQERFSYPDINKEGMSVENACSFEERLRRYWSFHRALNQTDSFTVLRYSWIDIEPARHAINTVTEAITRGGGETFGLWSQSAAVDWSMWRAALDRGDHPPEHLSGSEEERNQLICAVRSRVGHRLIIPLWYNIERMGNGTPDLAATKTNIKIRLYDQGTSSSTFGHTVLLEVFQSKEDGINHANIFDSMPHKLNNTESEYFKVAMHCAVNTLVEDIGWGSIVSHSHLHFPGTARQLKGDSKSSEPGAACTLHTILNGWARALRLKPDSRFVASAEFYNEALSVLNLALAGHVDSAYLFAWFVCKRFVDVSGRRPYSSYATQHFARTMLVGQGDSFEAIRDAALCGKDAVIQDRRLSEESLGADDSIEGVDVDYNEQQLRSLFTLAANIPDRDLLHYYQGVQSGEVLTRIRRRERMVQQKARDEAENFT